MNRLRFDLKPKIELLAKAGIRMDLRPDEVILENAHPLVGELVGELQSSLGEELRAEYQCYAFRFAGRDNETDEHTAKAWLWKELCDARNKITYERYIKNEFEDSLLFEKFPELQQECDDEGLLPVSLFQATGCFQTAVIYKNHAIQLSEAMPHELLLAVGGMAISGQFKNLKVRLSHYAIKPESEFHDYFQRATLYGPSFSDAYITRRLYAPNTATILQRIPQNEEEAKLFSALEPFDRLEINRSEKSNYVALMAEELNLLSLERRELGYIENRLFHSDIELGANAVVFKHADASILIYKPETYTKRLAVRFPNSVNAEGHFKLFWVGDCPMQAWKYLFRATFPKNELVAEFFTEKRVTAYDQGEIR